VRYLVFCALLAFGSSPPGAGAQANADYVPFRVVASSGTVLRVDIGARPQRARSLRRATVLTRSGAVRAVLVRTERVCEWLCEEKECHFEALLRASAPVDKPIAVLAGTPDVRAIATMSVGPARPMGNTDRWIDAEPIQALRWMRFPDGVFLTSPDMGRDFYAPPIDLASCSVRPVAPFTIVSCPTAELLYEGSHGIAVSLADYGEATVEPLVRLRLDGREAVVIRLGLKAAVATALLMRSDDGRWHLSFRDFDYSQLC
jgi:hypothetical protein